MGIQSWRGRRVLITGHTGFKGAWLTRWLLELGAEVSGFSLPEIPERSLFTDLALDREIRDFRGDLRDLARTRAVIADTQPDVLFHLAAQPLVRQSYDDPVNTFATNVQGSVHVLESARSVTHLNALVFVTSDKCYENVGKEGGYTEADPMGGSDPYSASKGAAEIVFQAYCRSFLKHIPSASARAGNVFGSGDWAQDRILPDCVRAWERKQTVELRQPNATRPWQHVLDCLSGYLSLAESLLAGKSHSGEAFNFGPEPSEEWSVSQLVQAFSRAWGPGAHISIGTPDLNRKEASRLTLDSKKARSKLSWSPRLDLNKAIEWTALGYRFAGKELQTEITRQLRDYSALSNTP